MPMFDYINQMYQVSKVKSE